MLVEVKGATFYYQKQTPLLQDIEFAMGHGEIMAVMGRNGIGKTTLTKCLAGILKWKSGRSFVAGEDSSGQKTNRHIGYVPQAHKSSFSYSVLDMVVFGKVGHGSRFAVPRKDDYQQAEAILERMDIGGLRDKRCNELSGGQLQLVFIARALVNTPQLLILDEPEAHLDFRNQLRLSKLLKSVVSGLGVSCIINTHYLNHAIRIADTCFLLGELDYQVGKVKDVMTDKNIENYFGVRSQTLYATYEGRDIPSFVFLDEA